MSLGQQLPSRDGNHFFKVIVNLIYDTFNESKRIPFIQPLYFGVQKEYLVFWTDNQAHWKFLCVLYSLIKYRKTSSTLNISHVGLKITERWFLGTLVWVPPGTEPEIELACKLFIWELIPGNVGRGSERREEKVGNKDPLTSKLSLRVTGS